MQSQDVFNRTFDATTTALDAWLDGLKDVAAVDREQTARYWRARLRPAQANACPVELMISRDQTFDLDVGTESLVNHAVADLGLFQPLMAAVVKGDVVCRSWLAQATGIELFREIVARLDGGEHWSMRRLVRAGSEATESSAVACDRVFVAYRRAPING